MSDVGGRVPMRKQPTPPSRSHSCAAAARSPCPADESLHSATLTLPGTFQNPLGTGPPKRFPRCPQLHRGISDHARLRRSRINPKTILHKAHSPILKLSRIVPWHAKSSHNNHGTKPGALHTPKTSPTPTITTGHPRQHPPTKEAEQNPRRFTTKLTILTNQARVLRLQISRLAIVGLSTFFRPLQPTPTTHQTPPPPET